MDEHAGGKEEDGPSAADIDGKRRLASMFGLVGVVEIVEISGGYVWEFWRLVGCGVGYWGIFGVSRVGGV